MSNQRALQLTMLMGEQESPAFRKAARQWLCLFIEEHAPTMQPVKIQRRDLRGWKSTEF